MSNHITRTKKALKVLLRLTVLELSVYFIITPDFFNYVPLLDPFFHWLNSVIVPTGTESDNVLQYILKLLFGWIPMFDIPMAIVRFIAVVIPVALVFTLIVYAVSLLFGKRKVRRKVAEADSRKVRSGRSNVLTLSQRLNIFIGHQKLRKDTVFSVAPKEGTCLRIQDMRISDTNFGKDVISQWNENNRITFGDDNLVAYLSKGKAYVSRNGKYVPLSLNMPKAIYRHNSETGKDKIIYILTWIGEE